MRKIVHFLFLINTVIFTISCEKENEPPCLCGIENPQDNLDWLNDLLWYPGCVEIYSVMYQGQEYVGIRMCDRIGSSYYDCNGNYFCGYDSWDGTWSCNDEFTEAIKNEILIYTREYDPNWEP